MRTVVRANKQLLGLLWEGLKLDPESVLFLPLQVNRTLLDRHGCLRFMIALEGKEVCQCLPTSATLGLTVSLASDPSTTGHDLASRLVQAAECSTAEAIELVHRLIAAGLLVVHAGISDHLLNWDRALEGLLRNVPTTQAQAAASVIQLLREGAADFQGENADCAKVLPRLRQEVRAGFSAVAVTLPNRRETVLYEDATADCIAVLTSVRPETRFVVSMEEK